MEITRLQNHIQTNIFIKKTILEFEYTSILNEVISITYIYLYF